jgi:hypothetical protein
MVLILPGAFIVITVISFLILFLPCLIYMIKKEMDQRREAAEIREQVVQNLPKIPFGSITL